VKHWPILAQNITKKTGKIFRTAIFDAYAQI